MNYYYLAASLPSLALGAPPPFSTSAFLSLCGEHMDPVDREALKSLFGASAGGRRHPFLKVWSESDAALRNSVAKARASRLRKDAGPHLRGDPAVETEIERVVADAFKKASPLDRELALDRFRWRRLEEIAGYNPFSSMAVLSYGARLLIAWRWHAMNDGAGMAVIKGMVDRQPRR